MVRRGKSDQLIEAAPVIPSHRRPRAGAQLGDPLPGTPTVMLQQFIAPLHATAGHMPLSRANRDTWNVRNGLVEPFLPSRPSRAPRHAGLLRRCQLNRTCS